MRRVLDYDLWLIGGIVALILSGILVLVSLGEYSDLYKQIIWAVLGLGLILALPILNIRALFSYRWFILGLYFVALAMLIATYFFAPVISGARSWIVFGDIQIQPSEFMKAALIILFSRFFAKKHVSIARFGVVISSFIYFLIPALLVMLQPDLGTAIILFGIWLGYVIFSGLPARYVLGMFVILILLSFISWNFILYDYQKERIIGLFNPNYDPLGINYSTIQSKIAIGSGGIWGKGFGQGTQAQLGFLPTATTDFIFAAFVEEWGIAGGFFIIGAFLVIIYRILKIGILSADNLSRFMAIGVVVMFLVHLVINIGSNIGLVPVIGVSMPFMSYGGSNLLTSSILVGIILNIYRKKSDFK